MNRQLAARAEAAAWITRLHGPNRTTEMEEGFRRWLSESEENRIEFEGLTDIWTAVGALPAGRAPRLERWECSVSVQERRTGRDRRKSRLRLALAAAVLPVIVAAWWLFHEPLDVYVTDIGEGRMVQLSDKSRIWMNSDTRLRAAFDGRQRRVELIRGEAFFEVARNVSRPFVVAAGGHAVTALGTSFLVRYEASRTAVTLIEGRVAISSSSTQGESSRAVEETLRRSGAETVRPRRADETAVGGSAWILTAGQRLTLSTAGVAKIDAPSVESVLAWRRGEVVLNDTPLREAVSEMNRYDKTAIVIAAPEIETLNISGLFHTGDNEGFARSVARMYRLDLREHDGRIYLTSR
jgi:transmembrane sensor